VLVLTLALAGIGFILLILALTTGSVAWAWGSIVVCVVGAVVLLAGALSGRSRRSEPDGPEKPVD
jgi:peptidoglycan/LPS O-acetylase OafA/YrhL